MRGAQLGRGLAALAQRHPSVAVGERGRGLLRGLVLAPGIDPRAALAVTREHGVLLTAAGTDVLRFTPPLVITEAQIDEALGRVDAALIALAALTRLIPGSRCAPPAPSSTPCRARGAAS